MIAGVCCLLALSLTLSECQDAGCLNLSSDLEDCIVGYQHGAENETVCKDDCKFAPKKYADACLGAGAESFKDELDKLCST